MQKNLLIDASLGRDSYYSVMTAFQNETAGIISICVQDPLTDRTVHGMLHLLDHLYTDIPVCKGRSTYINEDESSYIDKSAGKYPLDKPSLISSSEMMYLKANTVGSFTILGHSALTNIALFLKEHPTDKDKIEKIVLLENRTPKANKEGFDFQPLVDIDAAKIILESGVPVYFIPLDLLKVTLETSGIIEYLKESTDTMIGRFLHHSKMPDNDEAILCGLASVLTALLPEAVTCEKRDIHAVIKGERRGNFMIGKDNPDSSVSLVTAIDYKKALTPGFGVVDTPKTIAYNHLHEGEHHHHD